AGERHVGRGRRPPVVGRGSLMINRQVRLKSRPTGSPSADNFEIADGAMPPGDVVRRTVFLSLDPYMRGRMSDGPSYATPVAVGGVVGQLAKNKGCRAVGIAGSSEKCRYVVDELGSDACINYKTEDLVPALRTACPNGVDVYFENVGGAVLAAVLRVLNNGAR